MRASDCDRVESTRSGACAARREHASRAQTGVENVATRLRGREKNPTFLKKVSALQTPPADPTCAVHWLGVGPTGRRKPARGNSMKAARRFHSTRLAGAADSAGNVQTAHRPSTPAAHRDDYRGASVTATTRWQRRQMPGVFERFADHPPNRGLNSPVHDTTTIHARAARGAAPTFCRVAHGGARHTAARGAQPRRATGSLTVYRRAARRPVDRTNNCGAGPRECKSEVPGIEKKF